MRQWKSILKGKSLTKIPLKSASVREPLTLIFPTYCGSAFKNKGIQLILNAVIDYLPSPTEVKPQPEVDLEGNETGEFAIVDKDKPLRALAFKIMDDQYGALTFTGFILGSLKRS